MEKLVFENGIVIEWVRGLDGGGSTQHTDFLDYLKQNPKHYTHCLEWCAGLGAIGFSILDGGFCDRLSFNDLYEPAQTYILKNATANNLNDRVTFYLGDSLSVIPTDQKFDLVVANPPHVPMSVEDAQQENEVDRRLIVDTGWNIHRAFFSKITSYLLPGADVILSEIGFFKEHVALAEANGLKFIKSTPAPDLIRHTSQSAILMHYRYEA